MKTTDPLREEGYVHIRSGLSPSQIQQAVQCFQEQETGTVSIDNASMTRFITQIMLPRAARSQRWEYITYTKYRVSDNTNSSDAGSFHRDILTTTKAPPGPV